MDLMQEISRDGRVQRTQLSHKLTIDGISKPYEVYRIRLDALHYNIQNDRIATYISQYRAEHNGEVPDPSDLDAYNAIVESFIVKSNEDAIKRTTNNIRMFEQRVPGVVLSNGLIIDGNRRFTCLKRLSRDDAHFNWIEAVILPEEIASDQKRIKLLELAIQLGEEGKIDYNPIERLVGVYNDIIHNRLLTEEEYAKGTNASVSEVRKMVVQAGYMIDFLKFINADGQFYLAREMELSGPLQELPNILKCCVDEDEQEVVKNCVFANMVVEPAGDITRFVRKFKKILKSPKAAEFIENERELAAEVVDRLAEIPAVNKEAIREEIRADQDLVDRFARTMEASEAEANGAIILDTPLKKLDTAVDILDEVDTAVLDHLSDEDLKRAIRALNSIETRVDEIRTHIMPEE